MNGRAVASRAAVSHLAKPPADPERDSWTARVPTVAATILAVLAGVCAVAAVSEAAWSHTQTVRLAIDDVLMPAPPNLAYAAFVGILAVSAARRKRLALQVMVAFLGVQMVADLGVLTMLGSVGRFVGQLPGLSRAPAYATATTAANLAIDVGFGLALWLARAEFVARCRPASGRRAVAVGIGGITACALVGWALVDAVPGSLARSDGFAYAWERVLGGAFVFDVRRSGQAPGWVDLLLGLGGAATILAVMLTLFAAQRSEATLTAEDENRLRELLAGHGHHDSLGYFATRTDKSVVFSPSGKAAVTYRVVLGVCVASGDPLGDLEAWSKAIDAWLELTRRYAWTPAVVGASHAGATAFTRAGMRALEFGDEAIIDLDGFTLDGRDMRQVRQAVGRIQRAGYQVRMRSYADISAEEFARFTRLAAQWRDSTRERGFSMALGRFAGLADDSCLLMEAINRAGEVVAILSFVPWGTEGLSLDLMRRSRTSDNGLIEFMISELAAAGPARGIRRISLNFAVFRSVFENGARLGAGPVLRAWRGCLVFASRWYQLESLYRANAKYRPRWVPRYVCFDDHRNLLKVTVAIGVAEGFVAPPGQRLGDHLRGRPMLIFRNFGRRRGPPEGPPLPRETAL